ncbi:alcohol dehydrogenase [Zhengella mangrovi]|uniref:alcohol dehydrogenase n=1 Tax=Zhengella mangrovi TaxID=1982044 RepID=A0A2G1QIA1_9HYPH|nr:alcohol dehydrogenase [Zhengella mangrovi]PHP65245.1 alcohol dehydrogenase [Zhengella mangrovi]
MHCQCITRFGQPLEGQDRADMTPQGSEVILEVLAAGVCHTDLHVREGGVDLGHGARLEYAQRGVSLPRTLGHENVGRVIAAGPDAGDIDISRNYLIYPWCGCGVCAACQSGQENLCVAPKFLGIHVDGGYATQIRVSHPRYLFDIGDMDPMHAAPLACSGLTTYAALKKLGDRPRRQPVLIIGAGGLGLTAIQLIGALDMPAPVVADIDPAKREAARAAGAHAVVDPRDPDAASAIAKACGGAPSAVIDFVGAEATAKLGFDVLAKGGMLVSVGLFGGSSPWPLPLVALKAVTIAGSYVGSLAELGELLDIARTGAIKPIPTVRFPLSEAEGAMNRLEAGGVIGRAVLTPG